MAETHPVTAARPAVVTLPGEIGMATAGRVGGQLDAALGPARPWWSRP